MSMQKSFFRPLRRWAVTMRQAAAVTALLAGTSSAAMAAAHGAQSAGAPPPPPPPDPGVSVTVTQLNWENDQGSVSIPYSKVGVVTLTFDSYGASLVGSASGQFFNLEAVVNGQTRWSVQNLYLRYNSAKLALASQPSVQFLITNTPGTPVTQLQISYGLTSSYQVGLVKEPAAGAAGTEATSPPAGKAAGAPRAIKVLPVGTVAVGAPVVVPVTAVNYHVGGYNGGGSGLSTFPNTVSDWVGAAGPVTSIGYGETAVGADDLPAVVEDINGCAPAAVARSIQYMADNEEWESPGVQNIYDDLYDYMGTTLADGTAPGNIVSGKEEYNDDNDLPIETASYWWADASLSGLADLLDDDGDVELLIDWQGDGGHCAMVTSITLLSDGTYEITYIDDAQGDNGAENDEHTIYVDADGDFAGGTVVGFIAEEVSD